MKEKVNYRNCPVRDRTERNFKNITCLNWHLRLGPYLELPRIVICFDFQGRPACGLNGETYIYPFQLERDLKRPCRTPTTPHLLQRKLRFRKVTRPRSNSVENNRQGRVCNGKRTPPTSGWQVKWVEVDCYIRRFFPSFTIKRQATEPADPGFWGYLLSIRG